MKLIDLVIPLAMLTALPPVRADADEVLQEEGAREAKTSCTSVLQAHTSTGASLGSGTRTRAPPG